MAFWSEGYMYLGGKIDNLRGFIENGLQPVTMDGVPAQPLTLKSSNATSFLYENATNKTLWIRGSKRNFINTPTLEAKAAQPEEKVEMQLPICAAWRIDAALMREKSEKYGVDMEIEAYIPDECICQVIKVIDGKILRDDEVPCNEIGQYEE